MEQFKAWFIENLSDVAQDITKYGCDAGFPFIIYTNDTTELFDKFEIEIMAALNECRDSMGIETLAELVKGFGRADMAQEWLEGGILDDSTKCLFVWFACEEMARELHP